MKISVIIPTLNEEKYIGALLDSLVHHPRNEWLEIIVVDGRSNDVTVDIISKFPVILLHTSISSRAHQMNVGAKHAKGDILFFVHADVRLPLTFYDDIIEAGHQGFAAGCYRFRFIKKPNLLLYVNDFFTRFRYKWCRGGDQTLFIQRRLFMELGCFNEKFVIMEDYELLDRIYESCAFKIIPKSVGVSSRKYIRNSYFKVQLVNMKAMKMYLKGQNPEVIRKYYNQALN